MKNNLLEKIKGESNIAIAVSGGVDSLTLAAYSNRFFSGEVTMYHAISPAVPPQATERAMRLSQKEQWKLKVIDAYEFKDENYLNNPINRCFYCKSNLYGTISKVTNHQIFSGANTDDLKEFRPGLTAAQKHGVRHPFVEAGMGKKAVRALARELGLTDIADIPSSPCLSSRVETGIVINSTVLQLINKTELMVNKLVQPKTVRCRVRSDGVYIELDSNSMANLTDGLKILLSEQTKAIFSASGFKYKVEFANYKVGSAFLN